MTTEPRWHPDLLRRFVATPYVFSKGNGRSRILVASNDLEIALLMHRAIMVQPESLQAGGAIVKLIRDVVGPMDGPDEEILIISDEALHVLYRGRGTILIHDRNKSEIFGFVSRDVEAQELVSVLIPGLLNCQM